MAAKDLVQVACYLRPDQHKRLKKLAEDQITPMQVFLRAAVDQLLQAQERKLEEANELLTMGRRRRRAKK